ncbi:hypothetical protein CPB86DRAFT_876817 [Serendipita vermifera]|nr:hypothetical protein CPB86DRAFT_876817 [Serendipita vermifera]
MSSDLFATLADELILEIVNHLHTSYVDHTDNADPCSMDICRLSVCSQRLRRIALPLLYHTIRIPHPRILDRFLQTMLRNRIRTQLVKSLALDWYRCTKLAGWPQLNKDMDFSNVYEVQKLSPGFALNIEWRQPWAHGLLLLHILRDLETLCIKMAPNQYTQKFGAYLFKFLNERLVSTKLQSFSWDAGENLDLGILIPALLYSPLAEVQASQIVSVTGANRLQFLPQGTCLMSWYGTSSVEKLRLVHAGLLEKDFAEILRIPRNLTSLTYLRAPPTPRAVPPSLDGFKKALEIVSRNIVCLNFRWNKSHPSDEDTALWSFHHFTSLKVLYIEYTLLCGSEPAAAPCIASSLPPSLEVLGMCESPSSKWEVDDLVGIWERLLEKKSSTFLCTLSMIADLDEFSLLYPLTELAASRNVKIASNRGELEM